MARSLFTFALLAFAAKAAFATPKVGVTAPPFTLKTVDGRTITSADLRGKVVVLNLWATWCVPCRQELPTLDTYYQIQRKFGLEVFAVATEDSLPLYRLKE